MMITAQEVRVEMVANTASPIIIKDYKLKLSSKKLKSGKCQVKFHATMMREKQLYGYILVDADETLKQVVDTINQRLDMVKYRDTVHHINLYAIGKHFDTGCNFLVFDA
jgi:hypothetical protein